jgi:hypothetical protein
VVPAFPFALQVVDAEWLPAYLRSLTILASTGRFRPIIRIYFVSLFKQYEDLSDWHALYEKTMLKQARAL